MTLGNFRFYRVGVSKAVERWTWRNNFRTSESGCRLPLMDTWTQLITTIIQSSPVGVFCLLPHPLPMITRTRTTNILSMIIVAVARATSNATHPHPWHPTYQPLLAPNAIPPVAPPMQRWHCLPSSSKGRNQMQSVRFLNTYDLITHLQRLRFVMLTSCINRKFITYCQVFREVDAIQFASLTLEPAWEALRAK